MNLLGAIGKRPCEKALQKIMQELNDKRLVNHVMNLILDFRDGMKQINHVPEIAWRKRFTFEWRDRFYEKVFNSSFPIPVQTHLWCCMMAYFRDNLKNLK